MRRSAALALPLVALLVVGCRQLANPNDVASLAPEDRPQAAMRVLDSTKEYFGERVNAGEITDEQRNALLRAEADRLLNTFDPKRIRPEDQWIYGDFLRATGRTQDAAVALKQAADSAKTWDRRVNDTLRYATELAKLNKVPEALAAAQGVLKAPDEECAPILPATLYELVPAAEGKGHDKELADFLAKAEACHRRTKVDAKSAEGKSFRFAAAYHLRRAEEKIAQLRAGGTVRA